MPTAISPATFPATIVEPRPERPRANARKMRRGTIKAVVRRPAREQGMALETLGHAVEYLIDSRMFLIGMPYTRSEEEAVQILMSSSRQVFQGCPEVVPFRVRFAGWLLASFGRGAA